MFYTNNSSPLLVTTWVFMLTIIVITNTNYQVSSKFLCLQLFWVITIMSGAFNCVHCLSSLFAFFFLSRMWMGMACYTGIWMNYRRPYPVIVRVTLGNRWVLRRAMKPIVRGRKKELSQVGWLKSLRFQFQLEQKNNYSWGHNQDPNTYLANKTRVTVQCTWPPGANCLALLMVSKFSCLL